MLIERCFTTGQLEESLELLQCQSSLKTDRSWRQILPPLVSSIRPLRRGLALLLQVTDTLKSTLDLLVSGVRLLRARPITASEEVGPFMPELGHSCCSS